MAMLLALGLVTKIPACSLSAHSGWWTKEMSITEVTEVGQDEETNQSSLPKGTKGHF